MISATTSEEGRGQMSHDIISKMEVVINHLDSPWFVNMANLEHFFLFFFYQESHRYEVHLTGPDSFKLPFRKSRQAAKDCVAVWLKLSLTSCLSEYELEISSKWMKCFFIFFVEIKSLKADFYVSGADFR